MTAHLPPDVPAQIDPGDSVLVLSPPFAAAKSASCIDLLTACDSGTLRALCVLVTQSPAEHLNDWRRYGDRYPEETAIVPVDARPEEAPEPDADDGAIDPTVYGAVPPWDLTALGVRIVNTLDEWTPVDPDRRLSLCLRSVTALCQYSQSSEVLEFLEAVTARASTARVVANYHADPAAHDPDTLDRLRGVVDCVCRYEDDRWEIEV